ncbi:Pheophytinase, chloroplastic [Planktothrix tepida]|uniref:Alpha/beta hydrolase fold protein n=2 Tax=Planktothrix TaxID=54304 RepID=A0A1J1LDD9_9CYAN|nr:MULTISPECIES: alpha/beta fold hydrolase [Planktothrix]CAD5916167.1 Pheophytinase, chloroplastic [Planktothrix tepida]CAD5985695.1 Pheophytinase, chloroplastic [Planktothrix pseudagardhii]CUR30651.1 Alpha/beta hydrolase fold protein [Planktothrix tepida PCC 9214]
MITTPTLPSDVIPGQYWQWRDQLIYYVRVGERHPQCPSLLLVHGFGASTDHWRKNIQGLQSDFEVWAIDLLGFGRSGKPQVEYSGQLWRDQLQDFITEVIGQPVILAGNSLGGYASLCVASQCPSTAKGVILLNSAGPFTETDPRPEPPLWKKVVSQTMRSLFRQDWVSFLIFQWTRRRSIIRKTLLKVYLDPNAVTDQLVEEIYRPSCDPGAAQVFASVFKSPQGEKVDVLLHQLSCPLLLIWGEGDPWMNCRERSHKFHQYYPQLQEYFLQAGHCPHDEVPEQVNDLIRSWVLSRQV